MTKLYSTFFCRGFGYKEVAVLDFEIINVVLRLEEIEEISMATLGVALTKKKRGYSQTTLRENEITE